MYGDSMTENNITIDNYDTPEQVFINLIKQYKNRLERLSSDLTLIKDPDVYGYANTLFLKLQKEYFYLLSKDLELAKLFENNKNNTPQNPDTLNNTSFNVPDSIADDVANDILNDIFKTK